MYKLLIHKRKNMTGVQLPEPLRTLKRLSNFMLDGEIEAVADKAFSRFMRAISLHRAELDAYAALKGFERDPKASQNDWYSFLQRMAVQDEPAANHKVMALDAAVKRANKVHRHAGKIKIMRDGGLRGLARKIDRPQDPQLRKLGLYAEFRPKLP
jgi:hypothetical protein